ncbi:MAG: type II and III secretion system protein, partial [Prosthecobacter sp.]|nr:type II and III secretion system protein [Prosthecobacter sp.]
MLRHFFLYGLLSIWLPATSRAQMMGTLPMSTEEYEAIAMPLRQATPSQYDFSQAMLGDVIRFLATDAGIAFISLPQDSPEAGKLTTFSIKAAPFAVLETVCRANNLSVIYENGIFFFRPADDRELIGRSYVLRNNALERVEKISTGGMGSAGGGGGNTGGNGGNGGNGGGGLSSGLNLQGVQETFSMKPSEIIRDIRNLLGLPPDDNSSGLDAAGAGGALAGAAGAMTDLSMKAMNSNELSSFRQPKVIWKSDSNTLYVVATRLQHMWVDDFLKVADQPQALIALEVKFIETSRDPKREFGIDWGGTFEQGNFRAIDGVTVDDKGKLDVKFTQQATNGGYRTDLTQLITGTNLNRAGGALAWPALGILSAQDINVKLRALLRDEETQTTSYPRMVTLNNREVAIRSVVNQPVLDGQSSATVGAGATTSQSIAYLPIGTVLNILPKRMDGNRILLNMAVTVSSILGTEVIAGNPYPVASSRVYSAPVEIESGYTVAVGGLDEAREREGKSGVPFLQSIPLLGKAFKFDSKSKNHKNLMLFITPTLINARDGGLPAEPQSVIPQRPGRATPNIPQVDPVTGGLIGGVNALPNATSYLERETDILHHTIYESRITPDESRKLRELKIAIDQMVANAQALLQQQPGQASMIQSHLQRLQKLQRRHQELARLLF